MKKVMTIFGAILFASLILSSCGSSCNNCQGDGWVETGYAKYPCPKCDNVRE